MRVATLFAVSDLHVPYQDNRSIVEGVGPETDEDWLIVAGDVAELFFDVERTLTLLRSRFQRVIWVPGNHELWTVTSDPLGLRGEERYRALVRMCRNIGVHTPEDEYSVWRGPGGPAVVAPLFLLYDYSFRTHGTRSKAESLRRAHDAGIVCTDEVLLHPDPYPDRESWCWARVAETERRLEAVDPSLPTVLVSHWPLDRRPTDVLWYPEFAQWCGTERTAGWHTRFRAAVAVYGHLHIPRTTHYEGVRFEEVSLGYPREWQRRGGPPAPLRRILASS